MYIITLVDLPTLEAREQILSVHLEGELLDENIHISSLASQTNLYSGSDLKNMCVAAALTRVKEDILMHSFMDDPANKNLTREELLSKVHLDFDQVTDLTAIVLSQKPFIQSKLNKFHFECAMKEVGPSLTDEMQTLIELRKWDSVFGDNAKKKAKPGWGFGSASKVTQKV